MKLAVPITRIASAVKRLKAPKLSILVPYYHDDPVPLLTALAAELGNSREVEILIYDDGSNQPELSQIAIAAMKNCQAPAELFIAAENRGRSFARNQLTEFARADWVLFLDADMLPVTRHFIADYMNIIMQNDADIIFGGFKVSAQAEDPDRELHRFLSEVSDCLSLQARQTAGPKNVASSNLCVRKSVLKAEPFDPEFTGWGWEDSEWAARVAKSFNLVHADIPALHLGLETTETLLQRFKTSGPNYLRFTRKHPELAKELPLYRIIHKLQHIPGQKLFRPVLRRIVKLRFAPMKLRLFALKLWRASWYAETFA